jgi:hypothetical protein
VRAAVLHGFAPPGHVTLLDGRIPGVRHSPSIAFLALTAGAVTVLGAACSSFGSADPGVEAGDANPGADAADSADAALATDARPTDDVAVASDAFCTAHLNDQGFLYCNDFEMPTAGILPYGFTESVPTPTVTKVAVITDGSRHAVLQMTVDAPNAGSHEVSVRQALGTGNGPLSLQVDLDIKILTNSAPSESLAALHLPGVTSEASFGLGGFGGQTVGGTRNRDVTLRPYTQGAWEHLTIQVTKSATSTTGYRELTTYAGTVLVDRDAHASNGATPTDCTNDDLILGVTESGAAAANVIVLFDNVLVRKLE